MAVSIAISNPQRVSSSVWLTDMLHLIVSSSMIIQVIDLLHPLHAHGYHPLGGVDQTFYRPHMHGAWEGQALPIHAQWKPLHVWSKINSDSQVQLAPSKGYGISTYCSQLVLVGVRLHHEQATNIGEWWRLKQVGANNPSCEHVHQESRVSHSCWSWEKKCRCVNGS